MIESVRMGLVVQELTQDVVSGSGARSRQESALESSGTFQHSSCDCRSLISSQDILAFSQGSAILESQAHKVTPNCGREGECYVEMSVISAPNLCSIIY